jgi:hypothetical protein
MAIGTKKYFKKLAFINKCNNFVFDSQLTIINPKFYLL